MTRKSSFVMWFECPQVNVYVERATNGPHSPKTISKNACIIRSVTIVAVLCCDAQARQGVLRGQTKSRDKITVPCDWLTDWLLGMRSWLGCVQVRTETRVRMGILYGMCQCVKPNHLKRNEILTWINQPSG